MSLIGLKLSSKEKEDTDIEGDIGEERTNRE
jgi:hypothetical protein